MSILKFTLHLIEKIKFTLSISNNFGGGGDSIRDFLFGSLARRNYHSLVVTINDDETTTTGKN